jgi:hypothetical protein
MDLTTRQKFNAIKGFVKLKIPHNKQGGFSNSEKNIISRYYNTLKKNGYFDDRVGYEFKDISRSKSFEKIKGAPAIKKVPVNVGVEKTDKGYRTSTKAKITIRNGIVTITEKGMPQRWEFRYNIAQDWTLKQFVAHLKKQSRGRLRKGNILVTGAGLRYEIASSATDTLEALAKDILKMANKYQQQYIDNDENKSVDEWMFRIVVYQKIESIQPFRVKKKTKQRKKRVFKYEQK